MNNLSKKILKKIEQENIAPKSKLFFRLKNIFTWILTGCMILLASFFASGFYFVSVNSIILPGRAFTVLLFVTLISIFVALYLVYYEFKKIKNSYKKNIYHIGILAVIIVFIIGMLFSYFRVYSSFDDVLLKKIPSLSIQNRVHGIWSDNKKGLLAGEVISISEDSNIYIQSFNGDLVFVDVMFLEDVQQNIFIENLNVRMAGYWEGNIFYPFEVYPWSFQNIRNKKHHNYEQDVIHGNIKFFE